MKFIERFCPAMPMTYELLEDAGIKPSEAQDVFDHIEEATGLRFVLYPEETPREEKDI